MKLTSEKKWNRKAIHLEHAWQGPEIIGQIMASPFRRRYLGFRVLGENEDAIQGDQVKFLWCKRWLPINKRNAELANEYREVPRIIRRKL